MYGIFTIVEAVRQLRNEAENRQIENCNLQGAILRKTKARNVNFSNSVLEKCQIENSIIMENCQIKANVNLSGSIIANGSQIEANSVQNTRELLLGERSHLKL